MVRRRLTQGRTLTSQHKNSHLIPCLQPLDNGSGKQKYISELRCASAELRQVPKYSQTFKNEVSWGGKGKKLVHIAIFYFFWLAKFQETL